MNRTKFAAVLILVFTAQAQGPLHHRDLRRVETLSLKAKGLLPDTRFTVFLTEFEESRLAAAGYVGELETNEEGRGAMRVDDLIDPRRSLNHAVLRLSHTESEDLCFKPVTGQISSFDGRTASLATIFIRESRSIDDNDFLFHTINWRFTKCVSTF